MRTTILLFLASITRILSADSYVPPYPGNFGLGVPFTQSDMRYQQVYGAEAFSSLAPVGGWITAIGFERVRGSYEPGRDHINAQFSFSTTTRPVDGLSTTFAENVGSDEQVVIGPVDIDFENTPGGPASINIIFDTPFFYDPNQGNLLMDVRMLRRVAGFPLPEFMASSLSTDSSSYLRSINGRDELTGVANTTSLVTAFRITPVPEPSFRLLAVAALAALSLFSLRHKSSTRKD